MRPIHILGGLKRIPYSSRMTEYTFVMDGKPRGLNKRVEIHKKTKEFASVLNILIAKYSYYMNVCHTVYKREEEF